jgi:N6-adenosine-specific RNA methylase IME4
MKGRGSKPMPLEAAPVGATGYRGVSFQKDKGKHRASIELDSRRRHLGYYDTALAAALAYDAAAREAWGEAAVLNFPDGPPSRSDDADAASPAGGEAGLVTTRPEIEIARIDRSGRARKDFGDIAALAADIFDAPPGATRPTGLLHSIVITADCELIAGDRRIEAYLSRGRTTVPYVVADPDDILRAEWSENARELRKDFAPSEIYAIRSKVEERLGQRLGRPGNGVQRAKGDTRDLVGAFVGMSGRNVDKICDVMRAAEEDPERFGFLAEYIDKRGVHAAFGKLRRLRDEERVAKLAPRRGRFRTLLIDAPWEEEAPALSPSAIERSVPYATMSVAEIRALPVPDWAEEDCHLYLCVKNNGVAVGIKLIEHWGFQYVTVLNWRKPDIGLGRYFRNQSEKILFAVRGRLMTKAAAQAIATDFDAPAGEHSEKPERLYEIIRAASYAPYGEAFQRLARPDFVNLYQPAAPALQAAE